MCVSAVGPVTRSLQVFKFDIGGIDLISEPDVRSSIERKKPHIETTLREI